MEEQFYPIVHLTEQGIEFKDAIKDAKDDGKIRLWEWPKLIRELSDVIGAAKEIDANDIENISEGEIQTLSALVMDSINREVKFVREDVVNVLRIAQNAAQMIGRER